MLHIVIVDDDQAFLRSLQLILNANGFSVQTFSDPFHAFDYLNTKPAVNYLILDYAMPKMSGKDLFLKVKSDLSTTCKVILISGHYDASCCQDMHQLGFYKVLSKPLDIQNLFTVFTTETVNSD